MGLAKFQKKLFAAGYKYLPPPSGVLCRGCHQGSQNLPHKFDFPQFVFPRKPLYPFEPFTPTDLDDNADFFPRAEPRLKPDPKEDEREDCKIAEAFPSGGNAEHDALAKFVTGKPVEYKVTTPEGKSKQYDGMDELGVLYDVKTGHDWLQIFGQPDVVLNFRAVRSTSFGLGRLRTETIYEQEVAERCGHDFHLATNNRWVVQNMRELLGDIIEPVKIELVNFRWRE